MLRLAVPSDLPGILSLWQEAFGDSPEAAAFFFRSFPDCVSYVAEAEGEIVSMVHALPQLLSPQIPAAYLYAVATRKTHRGRGLCRELMAFAEQDLRSRGFACCVLTPGEPSLFSYYDRLGYHTAFNRRRTAFGQGRPISLQEYLSRRERLLTIPHMVYGEALLSYAAEVYDLTFFETADGIAAAGPAYTAEVLPQDLGGDPFAMLKWLTEARPLQNAYLGFPLE